MQNVEFVPFEGFEIEIQEKRLFETYDRDNLIFFISYHQRKKIVKIEAADKANPFTIKFKIDIFYECKEYDQSKDKISYHPLGTNCLFKVKQYKPSQIDYFSIEDYLTVIKPENVYYYVGREIFTFTSKTTIKQFGYVCYGTLNIYFAVNEEDDMFLFDEKIILPSSKATFSERIEDYYKQCISLTYNYPIFHGLIFFVSDYERFFDHLISRSKYVIKNYTFDQMGSENYNKHSKILQLDRKVYVDGCQNIMKTNNLKKFDDLKAIHTGYINYRIRKDAIKKLQEPIISLKEEEQYLEEENPEEEE